MKDEYLDGITDRKSAFDLPVEVNARPFGAPKIATVYGKSPAMDVLDEKLPTVEELEAALEAALPDKLHQIAILLRGLTCEEMWKLTGQMGKPVGFDKELINWAKSYMGEEVEALPPTKLQRRG